MASWMLLQLADSAFPTGGFAHSAGLEAMLQAGEVDHIDGFCAELIEQTAHGALPLVAAAWGEPERLSELDALARATLWSHVAARASRAQGRALADLASRAMGVVVPALADGHLAPVFGFVARALDVARADTLAAFLHLSVRGVLSAAVRLGACGPSEAQSIHLRLHPALERALASDCSLDQLAQTSPVVELVQAAHDRLYSRLFQS
jgi:urease accessory protein